MRTPIKRYPKKKDSDLIRLYLIGLLTGFLIGFMPLWFLLLGYKG